MIDRSQSTEPPDTHVAVSKTCEDGTQVKLVRFFPPSTAPDVLLAHEEELRRKLDQFSELFQSSA